MLFNFTGNSGSSIWFRFMKSADKNKPLNACEKLFGVFQSHMINIRRQRVSWLQLIMSLASRSYQKKKLGAETVVSLSL
jgi:hypothetical protein